METDQRIRLARGVDVEPFGEDRFIRLELDRQREFFDRMSTPPGRLEQVLSGGTYVCDEVEIERTTRSVCRGVKTKVWKPNAGPKLIAWKFIRRSKVVTVSTESGLKCPVREVFNFIKTK